MEEFEQYAIVFPVVFWKILWGGDKAVMDRNKVVVGDRQVPPKARESPDISHIRTGQCFSGQFIHFAFHLGVI